MRVVIAGGHGKIALHLERILSERGDQAVGLVRNEGHVPDVRETGADAEVIDLEFSTAEQVAERLAGADAVVFAAGAGPGSTAERKDTVDRGAAVLLADAAVAAGVDRYVLISSTGVDKPPAPGTDAVWAAYLRAKKAAEVEVAQRAVALTVLRPGRLTDDAGTGLVELAPPGLPRGDVTRADVAAVVAVLLAEPAVWADGAGLVLDLLGGSTPVADAVASVADAGANEDRGMSEQDEFDVVVIGAGAVGENVADYAVRGGLTAALVEAELVGGECSYWACMPSKALLRTSQAVAAARRLPGVHAAFDPAAVLTRRDEIASHWHDDSQVRWAEGAGIAVVRGQGRLTGVRTVTVTAADGTERVLRARHVVAVCTGSVPLTPPIPGLDQVRVWHSREATSAHEVPARLGVLGGGVVGAELAQAWASLGSRVTMLVREPRPLFPLEPIAGELVADGLRASGVDLRVDTALDAVKPSGTDGKAIELHFGNEVVEVDELLVATGRRPLTTGLGLAGLGVDEDKPLAVDDSGQVPGVEGGWLYAAGDVTGRALLTHQGKYAARIAGAAIAARARGVDVVPTPWGEYAATADHHAVPSVVFTDPEVASVGRTAARATAEGLTVRTVDLDIAVAGSYVHAVNYTGKARLVVDTDRDVLVGVTFVGPDVAEMLHAATIAVVGEVPMTRLWHAVPAYPTINEVWLRLLDAYRSQS